MTAPRVSVIIPAYNLSGMVAETVTSVLAQSYAEREIIVVDDGSTDDTGERLAPFLGQIRYVRQAHAGVASARNRGIALSRGDYLAFLDGDDVWTRGHLTAQVAVALKAPASGLVVCDGVQFVGSLEPGTGARIIREHLLAPFYLKRIRQAPEGIFTGMVHRAFISGPPIGCPAQALIPRAAVEAIGPWADRFLNDYDYYLRLSQRFPASFHGAPLVGWRCRPESISGPPEGRYLLQRKRLVPALRAHAERCDAADRRAIEDAIRRHEEFIRLTESGQSHLIRVGTEDGD